MQILRSTQVKPLALLAQVSRTDGNTICIPKSSGHLIFTFSHSELFSHTPLASFQNQRNIKTGGEFMGNQRLLPWPSDLQLFCRSLSRESRHCRASSSEGLNRTLRKKKMMAMRIPWLTTYTNSDLDLLFFQMIQPMTHSQDKGSRVIFSKQVALMSWVCFPTSVLHSFIPCWTIWLILSLSLFLSLKRKKERKTSTCSLWKFPG